MNKLALGDRRIGRSRLHTRWVRDDNEDDGDDAGVGTGAGWWSWRRAMATATMAGDLRRSSAAGVRNTARVLRVLGARTLAPSLDLAA